MYDEQTYNILNYMYSTWIIYICLSTFLLMLCLVKSKLKVFHVPRTNWRSQRVRVISDSAPIGAIKQMHFVIAVMYVCIRVNIPSIYSRGSFFLTLLLCILLLCFVSFSLLFLFCFVIRHLTSPHGGIRKAAVCSVAA